VKVNAKEDILTAFTKVSGHWETIGCSQGRELESKITHLSVQKILKKNH
jgi:hypothetical protein